jgi:hypothetical protein
MPWPAVRKTGEIIGLGDLGGVPTEEALNRLGLSNRGQAPIVDKLIKLSGEISKEKGSLSRAGSSESRRTTQPPSTYSQNSMPPQQHIAASLGGENAGLIRNFYVQFNELFPSTAGRRNFKKWKYDVDDVWCFLGEFGTFDQPEEAYTLVFPPRPHFSDVESVGTALAILWGKPPTSVDINVETGIATWHKVARIFAGGY